MTLKVKLFKSDNQDEVDDIMVMKKLQDVLEQSIKETFGDSYIPSVRLYGEIVLINPNMESGR